MKSRNSAAFPIPFGLLALSLVIVSCKPNQNLDASHEADGNINHPAEAGRIISRENLKEIESLAIDQEVTVSGYLFTHEDGPWLASDLDRPLRDVLSLKISEESKIASKDESQPRWWYKYDEGFPVLITGTLRIENYKEGGRGIRINHPYMEVSIAQEVDVSNHDWKSSRRSK